MDYIFESEQFALSEHSLHLLRSRYNYRTYPNEQIREIIIEEGRLVNRWIIVLAFGITLLGLAIYYGVSLYLSIYHQTVRTVYIEQIVIPVLPLFIGGYCVYWSLRTGPVAKVVFDDGKGKKFPLDGAQKEDKIHLLTTHLKQSEMLKNKSTVRI